MKASRREFIRQSAVAASALAGSGTAAHVARAALRGDVRDAGMQMSEAYFDGFNQHKIALCRQMDVLGAVGGINPRMVGLNEVQPWDLVAVKAVKNAWDNQG